MKIFAYNLCLQFEVRNPEQNYEFSLISFEELMSHLFKGMDFDSQVFYLKADHSEEFGDNIFDLQSNDVWRNIPITVICVFPSEQQKNGFLDAFKDRFRHVDAAGGMVVNEKKEYLLIYNRGRWALPKGGVEWQEEIQDAAVREVKEETGLTQVEITHEIPATYHTFRRRRKWVLKTTYWYKMAGNSEQPITPQKDEGIEEVRWADKEGWFELAKNSYPLIQEIFESEFARSLTS